MAKRARNKVKTEAEIAAIEADRVAAHGPLPAEAFQGGNVSEEIVVLEPTEEGLQLMQRAIEEGKQARFATEGEQPTEREVDEREDEDEEQPEEIQPEDVERLEDELAEQEEEKKGGVVKEKFKKKYAANAAAIGATHKSAKRSTWDWLAQEITKFCNDDKGKIDIRAFVALLNVNGVDHSRWTNRNRGWEGRFRMTGRVALQKIVATNGYLALPDDVKVEAPADWRERFLPKA